MTVGKVLKMPYPEFQGWVAFIRMRDEQNKDRN